MGKLKNEKKHNMREMMYTKTKLIRWGGREYVFKGWGRKENVFYLHPITAEVTTSIGFQSLENKR